MRTPCPDKQTGPQACSGTASRKRQRCVQKTQMNWQSTYATCIHFSCRKFARLAKRKPVHECCVLEGPCHRTKSTRRSLHTYNRHRQTCQSDKQDTALKSPSAAAGRNPQHARFRKGSTGIPARYPLALERHSSAKHSLGPPQGVSDHVWRIGRDHGGVHLHGHRPRDVRVVLCARLTSCRSDQHVEGRTGL